MRSGRAARLFLVRRQTYIIHMTVWVLLGTWKTDMMRGKMDLGREVNGISEQYG